MATYKHYFSNGHKGKITYNKGIVSGIVSLAVSEVEGVALLYKNKKRLLWRGSTRKEGVKVNFEKDGIYVDVSVKVFYGFNVPDIAFKIQQNIKHNVEAMSEFKIVKVDVHVLGVIFKDEPLE